MAKGKRKGSHREAGPSKRAKTAAHAHGEFDPDKDYKLKQIIDERNNKYLIEWEDDEVTGEAYENTWEPKRNANRLAVADWEERKKEAKTKASKKQPSPLVPSKQSSSLPTTPARPRIKLFNRRIIDSSPQSDEVSGTQGLIEQAQQQIDKSLEIEESQHEQPLPGVQISANSPLFEPEDRPEPIVHLPNPPSSYLAGDYQKVVSSEGQSSPEAGSPEPSQYVPEPTDSSKDLESAGDTSLAVTTPSQPNPNSVQTVEQSQAVPGSSSYAPSGSGEQSSSSAGINQQTQATPDPIAQELSTADEQLSRGVQTVAHRITSQEVEPSQIANEGRPDQLVAARSVEPIPSAASTLAPESLPSQDQNHIGESTSQVEVPTNSFANHESEVYETPGAVVSSRLSDVQPYAHINGTAPARDSRNFRQISPSTSDRAIAAQTQVSGGFQEELSPLRSVTVTPPSQRDLIRQQLNPHPHLPSSSLWASELQVQTQTSRPQVESPHSIALDFATQVPLIQDYSSSHHHTVYSQDQDLGPISASAPVEQSSPLNTTSPIPPPPFHSLDIVASIEDTVPPPRPTTPSTPRRSPGAVRKMESDEQPPSMSRPEFLKALREKNRTPSAVAALRAKQSASPSSSRLPGTSHPLSSVSSIPPTKAAPAPLLGSPVFFRDGPRSPSAVPAMEPLRNITHEEMTTSERYETLLPQAQEANAGEKLPNGTLSGAETPDRHHPITDHPETADVHAAPICFGGHQRDQYQALVYFFRDSVNRFLASSDPDEAMIEEAQLFIERARRVAMHPDLDNAETLTQFEDVSPAQQANWDTGSSAKFRFLRELLAQLQNSQLHIAIITSPGRITNILETFLHGINIRYSRLETGSNHDWCQSQGSLNVSLLDTDTSVENMIPADLVIAIDNSAKHDSPLVRLLRKKGGQWSPLVYLVVPHSVEHVERCLSPALTELNMLRALVGGIQRFKNEVGKAEEGQLPPGATAIALAKYLSDNTADATWPLATLSKLEDLDSQTESEVDNTGNSINITEPAKHGEKRARELDVDMDDPDSHKRSRVQSPATGQAHEIPSTITLQDVDITHISDSVGKGTQPDAHASLPNATEKRLRELLKEAQDRLEEHVQALGDLQYRHEEQRHQLVERTTERDRANETAQRALTRLNEDSNKMSALRVENATLREQLKQANESLRNSTIPGQAEYQAMKQISLEETLAKEKAESRLKEANSQLNYVRELYQTASNSAQSLASELQDVKAELAVAQTRASGEQARAKQTTLDDFSKNLQGENKRLKAIIQDRDAALKFRDEEIMKMKEASRGRMGTRGTSVPRSPRLGSPAKMERRIGSRQASPAGGERKGRTELLHPLRNS